MPGFMNTSLIGVFILLTSAASPRILPQADGASAEPTCDELRYMWRFTKRQSRTTETTNEIPTYKDPFTINLWEDGITSVRSAGGGRGRRPPIYGRLVQNLQRSGIGSPHDRVRNFQEVVNMFQSAIHVPQLPNHRGHTAVRQVGGNVGLHLGTPPSSSFQHLKELIQSERSRELHEQMSEERELRQNHRNYQPTGRRKGRYLNFPVEIPSNVYYMQRTYAEPILVSNRTRLNHGHPSPGLRHTIM